MSAPSYELTSIADIFNKVPAERIPDCCAELGKLMSSTKAAAQLMFDHAKASGANVGDCLMHEVIGFRFPMTWVDDGAGSLETNFMTETDEPIFTLKLDVKK
jgi:hypothetical protein